MNVFHRFTRRSLRKNPTRTAVTIIGIMLSMALFTAVIEGAYSGMQFLIRSEIAASGAYHGYYSDMTPQEAPAVAQQSGVRDTASWQAVGWADIGSGNDYKPYLLIEDIGEGFTDLVSVRLTAGRLPQTGGEILLPEHLRSNGGVTHAVGDTLTLSVGCRVADGQTLTAQSAYNPDAGEQITDTREITYTVVGTYERLSGNIERYDCPGYIALTAGGGTGNVDVFFTLRHPGRFYREMGKNAVSDHWTAHTDLLYFYGSLRNGNLTTVLYGFAAILVVLIAFGSVTLIYNSFAISVSERTRQFGILKSVGATRRQIRSCVLYEALLLCGIAIPLGLVVGCVGIGVTLYCLRDAFAAMTVASVQMALVLNPGALLIAVSVCLLTTLAAAFVPAKRALRVSPIEAIRQITDIRVSSREVHISPLTRRLFGFTGMMAAKNYKRNRRRYRSTVLSLFLSVTLFISASSFCSYFTRAVGDINADDIGADLNYYYDAPGDPAALTEEEVYRLLSDTEGVTGHSCLFTTYVTLRVDGALTANGKQREEYGFLVFLDDDTFRQTCRDNGIDPAAYTDAQAPRALLCNDITTRVYDEDGNSRWEYDQLVKPGALPGNLLLCSYDTPEGMVSYSEETADGVDYWLLYPQEYLEQLDGDEAPDPAQAQRVPVAELEQTAPLTVGATLKAPPAGLPGNAIAVICPMSARAAVVAAFPEAAQSRTLDMFFTAPEHRVVFDRMKRTLTERGLETDALLDVAEEYENRRMLVSVVDVFSYGFIILISLIAVANVFNTISTNVSLRRREFAMLRSVGLGQRDFRRMMNYECIIYGMKGLLYGLPAALLMTFAIWRIAGTAFGVPFYVPWHSVVIAVASVFAVVFVTMLYATRKIRQDNPVEALRSENI